MPARIYPGLVFSLYPKQESPALARGFPHFQLGAADTTGGRQGSFGFVHQDYLLFPHLDVAKNIVFAP
ncbi:MAG: hypothetical protein GX572_04140 [Clostridia bacterium]|nr:hypothetical protein [Clostridia bacterium]